MKNHRITFTLVSLLLLACVLLPFSSCSKNKRKGNDNTIRIAMITDSGDVTDLSFNQSTYEACKAFATEYDKDFRYFKPTSDSTESRKTSIDIAIAEDYNVIVTPGYLFSQNLIIAAVEYPDIYFIGLDITESDLVSAAKDLKIENFEIPKNLFCACYTEVLSGFFAGYAAVMEGYRHLGFLGGMAISAVQHFGFGYIQGIDAAAKKLGITNEIEVEYIYAGQFFSDQAITAAMDTWYGKRKVEIVFSCGGGVFASACEAAIKTPDGKVIGVDQDQRPLIDKYRKDLCLTSAIKNLPATLEVVLKTPKTPEWEKYGGKVMNMGLVSSEDVSKNYVGLPLGESWKMKNFTVDEYKALLRQVMDGKITVSAQTGTMPPHAVKVNEYPNIK